MSGISSTGKLILVQRRGLAFALIWLAFAGLSIWPVIRGPALPPGLTPEEIRRYAETLASEPYAATASLTIGLLLLALRWTVLVDGIKRTIVVQLHIGFGPAAILLRQATTRFGRNAKIRQRRVWRGPTRLELEDADTTVVVASALFLEPSVERARDQLEHVLRMAHRAPAVDSVNTEPRESEDATAATPPATPLAVEAGSSRAYESKWDQELSRLERLRSRENLVGFQIDAFVSARGPGYWGLYALFERPPNTPQPISEINAERVPIEDDLTRLDSEAAARAIEWANHLSKSRDLREVRVLSGADA